MEVKRRTLIRACSALVVVLICGIVIYQVYDRKQKKELALSELKADYDRAVEREYKSLLREYESIVETINDYSYSYSLRFKYVMKLNKLLDCRQYENTGFEYSTVDKCIEEQPRKKEEDLKILKQKASYAIFEN